MAIYDRDIDVVDAYLLDELTDDEKVYFESRLANRAFKEYLQEQTLLKEVINEKGRYKMKDELQVLEAEYHTENTNKVAKTAVLPFYKRKNVIAVAACIFLLVSVIGFFNISDEISSETLFASNYSPYPNLIDPITKGANDINTPYQLYESGDYAMALSALLTMPESNDRNWYLAQCYLAMGEDAKAEAILLPVSRNLENEYQEPAQWYLALLHIKDNDLYQAKSELDRIASTIKHPYALKAKDLLLDMK